VSDVDSAPDPAAVKRALSRLVDDDPLARGERALESLPVAAGFAERGGLADLRTVAATAEGERAVRARRVLDAFRAFRMAARSDYPDQFHCGRDTPLGRDG
jgi:hypothetical protein